MAAMLGRKPGTGLAAIGALAAPAALLAVLLLSPACVSKWALRTSQPEIALQWPYQPNRAKVTYVESLTGFGRHKGSASALRAVVYGREKEAPDSFVLPVAVATGGDGRIAVADMGRRCVHLFLPAQRAYFRLDGSKKEKIQSPVAVIFDDELRLYLSDSAGRVFVFGPGGEFLRAMEKAGEEALQRPTGLAYNPRRKLLYVVDTLAHRIHAFGSQGELAFSFGQRGVKEGEFNFPTHIFWSSSGELYVTDSLNFRIEILDEMGKPLGSFGHHGDGSGDLAMPKGVAVDGDGAVYVVDSLFDNVQLFNRRGEFLLTVGRRGIDFGEFWLPSGVFINERAELYVCDTYNRRIQIFRITEQYAENTP
jgi:DNA-binding beta-propeller fold protein YncE